MRTLRLMWEVIWLAWDRLTIKMQRWIILRVWNLNHYIHYTAWYRSGQLRDTGQKYSKTLTLNSRNLHSEQKDKINMCQNVSVSRTQRLGSLFWGAGRIQVWRECGYMERWLCCHQIWKFRVALCPGSAPPTPTDNGPSLQAQHPPFILLACIVLLLYVEIALRNPRPARRTEANSIIRAVLGGIQQAVGYRGGICAKLEGGLRKASRRRL